MNHINFESLDSIDDIAGALGCQPGFLQCVLDYPSNFYVLLRVPRKKRPEEPRIVYEVRDTLKNIHKNILVSIAAKVVFPEYVQGFVSKRSIVTNASLHLGQKYILNFDIKNFFGSIRTEKIVEIFVAFGCGYEVASIFAQLCTFNGVLVQGANTSPILANLVCKELDKELFKIGLEHECSYSRYADDITFSGESVPKKKIIAQCVEKYGFKLNQDKWKCQCRGKAQYVTGLTVFDKEKPRLPKQVKRRLRQELYYANKHGLTNHLEKIGIKDRDSVEAYISRTDGLIAFMYSVEPNLAYHFDAMWQTIRSRENRLKSRDPYKILTRVQGKDLNSPRALEQSAQQVKIPN